MVGLVIEKMREQRMKIAPVLYPSGIGVQGRGAVHDQSLRHCMMESTLLICVSAVHGRRQPQRQPTEQQRHHTNGAIHADKSPAGTG